MTQADDPPGRLLQLIAAGWAAQALRAAVELGLPETMDTRARPVDELGQAAGCDLAALRRLLRALVTLEVCREPAPDRFVLTELGAHLRRDHPHSLHAWTQWWGGNLWPLWPHLAESVRTGQSARTRLAGTRGFEHLAVQGSDGALFHRAMAELAALVADRLATAWDFAAARCVVDVGGGSGAVLAAVLRAHPALRGVLLEQAHALPEARATLAAAGLAARCEVLEGDFFAQVPTGADVYILKSVLHDWPDDDAVRILQSCARAMRPASRLLVVERVLPRRAAPTAQGRDLARSDLTMLLAHGAGERTAAQLRALLVQAGLRAGRRRVLGLTMSVIEAGPR